MNLDLSDSVILLRWGHILAAAIAVGGLFFVIGRYGCRSGSVGRPNRRRRGGGILVEHTAR
ncbi:MAG: hypothetical protein ACKPKO_51885 [Candidatus Fonsibacter sp.]